jgi:hypothetical protein
MACARRVDRVPGVLQHGPTAQGIAQHIPDGEPDAPRGTVTDIDTQQIHRKPVLGGPINEYMRAA